MVTVMHWPRKAITFFLYAYVLSLFVSMASMELCAWTLTGLALAMIFARAEKPFALGIEIVIWPLVACVVIGWALNRARGSDLWFVIGGMRWVATLYTLTWILRWRRTSPRILVPYFVALGVAGIYGIVTSVTAWDFVRHRADQFILPGGMGRALSFLGFPMTWGHTSAMALCFCIAVIVMRPFDLRSRQGRWFFAGACAVAMLTAANLALTFTRGAWLGATAGTLGIAILLGRKALATAILAGAIAIGGLSFASDNFRDRVMTISSMAESSNFQRLALWRANWMMFQDHPFFGVGLNENESLVGEYHRKLGDPGAFTGHAHSTYLQFLASAGGIGFVLFMATFLFYLVWTYRIFRIIPVEHFWPRAMALGSFGAQIALHVGGVTECNFKAMTVNHHFIFQLALAASLKELYAPRRS